MLTFQRQDQSSDKSYPLDCVPHADLEWNLSLIFPLSTGSPQCKLSSGHCVPPTLFLTQVNISLYFIFNHTWDAFWMPYQDEWTLLISLFWLWTQKRWGNKTTPNKFIQILQLDHEPPLFILPAMKNVQQQGYIKTNHTGILLSLMFPCWLFFFLNLFFLLISSLAVSQLRPTRAQLRALLSEKPLAPHAALLLTVRLHLENAGCYLSSGHSCWENHVWTKGTKHP